MTQPKVEQTEIDGALGVLPPSSGNILVVVGVSSAGTKDTPATFGNAKKLAAAFGAGPLVEAAARHIETTGDPVAVIRTGQTTAGAYGTIDDDDVDGTSAITTTADTAPLDDYEVQVRVVDGGTIGTAGITYQWSLDAGRTWSPVTALGTDTAIAIDDSGVSFDLADGTLVAGDAWSVVTTAPAPNSTELGSALDALKASAITWELAHIACPIDATLFDTIETKFAALQGLGKFRAWIGSVAMPTAAQTEATYLSTLTTTFASKASVLGELCAGAVRLVSSVSGRVYRRPWSFAQASLEASASAEIDVADINRGSVPGASITDSNGNNVEHDESLNPGLDDARFSVARSWEGYGGVYSNRPRLFSNPGSDFDLMPKRRVMNLARAATSSYLIRRLNQPILVDKTTGFIREEEALEIEAGGRAALAAALGAEPKASAWSFVVARNDNVLSTKTLTVTVRIVPLAYVETIEETIGFENPALRVTRA